VTGAIHERAFAKVNLVLQVGAPREDGLHPICSLLTPVDLADELTVAEGSGPRDEVHCTRLPDETLCRRAVEALRGTLPDLPPLEITIDKRIPVAAGLGGGSADAAAVLRAGNELAGGPLDAEGLRELAAGIGSDVPSQVEQRAVLIEGAGEQVEAVPLSSLALVLVLVPQGQGLSTAAAYAELDRLGAHRERLTPDQVRLLAAAPPAELAAGVENDLEAATLSLRPELESVLVRLRDAGALAAAISGSGPTAFGLFDDSDEAGRAAGQIDRALALGTR
jgi:4-diphosphocytidyl-2-C-methyl-D-erythritol kinase